VETVEAGAMTKDLALLVGDSQGWLTTEGFIDKVAANSTRPWRRADPPVSGASADPLRPGALPRSTSPWGEELRSQLLPQGGAPTEGR
jgi:hypothetical protein